MKPQQILDDLNQNLKITLKGKERTIDWFDGLNYTKEISEFTFRFLDEIVTSHQHN